MSAPGLIGCVLAGYFVVLVGLSLARVVPVRSSVIQRLRAFFPSWKFFDDVGTVPAVLARSGPDENQLGDWRPCLRPVRRRLTALFVNPGGTLALAHGTLLAQLVADVEDLPAPGDVEAIASYQLTRRLVQTQLGLAAGTHYQFKICLVEPGAVPGPEDDMLVSPVYTA